MSRGTPAYDATATLAELAGLKRGTRVRVVAPDAWLQPLQVSAQRVQGVSDESVAELLAYEAETFSGVPAEKGLVAFRRESIRAGMAEFLTLQVTLDEIAALRRTLKAAGLVLAGVTHPAFLEGGGEAPMVVPPPEPKTPRELFNDAGRWLLVVGALVWAAQFGLARANGALEREMRAVEAERDRCGAIQAAAEGLRRDAAACARDYEETVVKPLRLVRARRSYTRILDALARTCPKGGMVSEMKSDGDYTLAISGLTTTNTEAEQFLKDLAMALKDGGFAVATLSLASMNQLPDGGPWRFRCRIQPQPGEVLP